MSLKENPNGEPPKLSDVQKAIKDLGVEKEVKRKQDEAEKEAVVKRRQTIKK